MGFFKKVADNWGSLEKTCEVVAAQYDRSRSTESSTRLFEILSTRPGWKHLPHSFVKTITDRLASVAQASDEGMPYPVMLGRFIWTTEQFQMESNTFPALATTSEDASLVAQALSSGGLVASSADLATSVPPKPPSACIVITSTLNPSPSNAWR